MAIIPKGAAPREGPNSFDQLDQAVLAGFVAPGARTTTGKSKIAAGRIRARITAVELWVVEGEQPQHGVLAQTLGVSDRWLSYHFQSQSELYAFPPPELASSLVEAASSSHEWTNIARLIRPVFDALESNHQGRALMAGLVVIHRNNPHLDDTDAHFAMRIRSAIRDHRQRRTLSIADLFTGGVRLAFEDWVDSDTPNLSFVADRIGWLLTGPISDAYDALLAGQPAQTASD